MISIIVVACNKDHGLLAEEINIGFLRGYRASICLKENHHPSYMESRKLLIPILPMIVAEF